MRTACTVALAIGLTIASWASPSAARAPLSGADLDALIRSHVSDADVRGFVGGNLQSANWGGYRATVEVSHSYTVDQKPRIFRVDAGAITVETPEQNVDTTASRTGLVTLSDKETAFVRGVPFFIGDVTVTPPETVTFRVWSNPAATIEGARWRLQRVRRDGSGYVSSVEIVDTHEIFASGPESRVLTLKHRDAAGWVLSIVVNENYGRRLMSNEIELERLVAAQPQTGSAVAPTPVPPTASEPAASPDRTTTAARAHSGRVTALAITPDGQILASASFDRTIRLWSLPGGKPLRVLTGHRSGVYSMAMAADGSSLTSGSHEEPFIVWSLPDGQIVSRLDSQASGSTTAMGIAPAGNFMAAGTFSAAITIWSQPQGTLLKTLSAAAGINALALSPDGRVLIAGSFGPIELWSVPDGAPLGSLNTPQQSVDALAVTPDGRTVASASGGDDTVKLWSLAERRLLTELKGNRNGAHALAVAADGKTLAAGCGDGAVRLWSLPDGSLQATLPGDPSEICALAFSSGGNLLATGDDQGAIALWDAKKGVLVGSLSGQ